MKRRNVLTWTGGGGESLNRVHYGGDTSVINNYRCSCCDNFTKFDGQH